MEVEVLHVLAIWKLLTCPLFSVMIDTQCQRSVSCANVDVKFTGR